MQFKATTPRLENLTPKELQWLKELGLGSGVYLDDRVCDFRPGYCHLNVLYYCMKNPEAEIVSGWLLWKSSLMFELEFHSVVRVDGWLLDITKRIDGEKDVLFFEDRKLWAKIDKGSTHTFDNIRYPLMGRNRKEMQTFAGTFTEVFHNFAVKGKPILTEEQREFLQEMVSGFLR